MNSEYQQTLDYLHSLAMNDEDLSSSGNCRNSVIKIASAIKRKFPDLKTEYLAFPDAGEGFGVHYSLLLSTFAWDLIVNLVQSPGFPEYLGGSKNAAITFSSMKVVPEVI